MYDYKGKSALITGGGGGIGREIALTLARQGCNITVADIQRQGAEQVAAEIRQRGGQAQSAELDVCNNEAQEAVFRQHADHFGALDIAVLNAGIGEASSFLNSSSTDWQKTLDVDLRAVMFGVKLAADLMHIKSTHGVILINASAGGLFPMPYAPVYAAAKAGLVNFTRSFSQPLAKRGIRLSCVCPQPVDTSLVSTMKLGDESKGFEHHAAKLLTVAQVAAAFLFLIQAEQRKGTILMLHSALGQAFEWTEPKGNLRPVKIPGISGPQQAVTNLSSYAQWATTRLPAQCRAIQVHKLSTDFRAATRFVDLPLQLAAPKGHVLMRRIWAGINASDINFTAGRYFGSVKESEKRLPFNAGFEAVGIVAAVGEGVSGMQVGQPVAEMGYGCFSDWGVLPASSAIPVATPAPEIVALLTSGLTASIGLTEAGRMGTKERVLVTAAAGGTGQFVVQLAKAAGNTVIATCGSDDKAVLLKRLGADRVINYRSEDVGKVLRSEYPQGMDVVWESVGGDMLQTCVRSLAVKGRLIVIGMMSQYASGWAPSTQKGVAELLLAKSATMTGFFYPHYFRKIKSHLPRLISAWSQGRLHISIDPTRFVGLNAVPEAVDHLQAGKSVGKVVVQIATELPSTAAAKL